MTLTERVMSKGYLLEVDQYLWLGMVKPMPMDLGMGKVTVPLARHVIQVMSKAWIRKVMLLKNSVRHSTVATHSHALEFKSGKRHRFVLAGVADTVAHSLDKASDKLSRFYEEVADDFPDVKRVARQVLSKNSDHLWRTVSHLFPQYPDRLKAPDAWKADMIETLMLKRFPSEARIRSMRLTYSMFRTEDTMCTLTGRCQVPFPGELLHCQQLLKAFLLCPEDVGERLTSHIGLLLRDFKGKGLYVLTMSRLEKDLTRLLAYNPDEVPGHELAPRVAQLRGVAGSIDRHELLYNKAAREKVAREILALSTFMAGPWKGLHDEMYNDLYGGGVYE